MKLPKLKAECLHLDHILNVLFQINSGSVQRGKDKNCVIFKIHLDIIVFKMKSLIHARFPGFKLPSTFSSLLEVVQKMLFKPQIAIKMFNIQLFLKKKFKSSKILVMHNRKDLPITSGGMIVIWLLNRQSFFKVSRWPRTAGSSFKVIFPKFSSAVLQEGHTEKYLITNLRGV